MIGESRTYTVCLEVTVRYSSKGYRSSHNDPGAPREFEIEEIELGKKSFFGGTTTAAKKAEEAIKLLDAITYDAELQAVDDGGWDDLDPDYQRDMAAE